MSHLAEANRARTYFRTFSMPGDITDKSEITLLAKEVGDQEPKGIHLLVNNVRIAWQSTFRRQSLTQVIYLGWHSQG